MTLENLNTITIPYGSNGIRCYWSKRFSPQLIQAAFKKTSQSPSDLVHAALDHPMGCQDPFSLLSAQMKISIVINDKTRPVPNNQLLVPLLEKITQVGIPDKNIKVFIASGTHLPMQDSEYPLIVSPELSQRFIVVSHDCDDVNNLVYLGETTRHTPVWVNKNFYESDLRIVVGDIEPHHFAGYSGGVKSAAIGLGGRETISANHSLLLDEKSAIGIYAENPLRMDIEEIGSIIKVDLALNAVLNDDKQILKVFFGNPHDVMTEGIVFVDSMCRIPVKSQFDVVIASPGGYPRDINLYQSQKALTTSAQFCKPGGTVILVAECREGIGSQGYAEFIKDIKSVDEVIHKFSIQDFALGAHKAFLTARIQKHCQTYLLSSLSGEQTTALFYKPFQVEKQEIYLDDYMAPDAKVAIMPYAPITIPGIEVEG